MRRLIASSVLVAGLMAAIPALAAAPAAAPPAAPPPHAAKSTAHPPADPAEARCAAAWQAQTSHTQTKAAFMAACLHHG